MSAEDYKQGYRDGFADAMKQSMANQNPLSAIIPQMHVNEEKTDVIVDLRKKIEALKDRIESDVKNTDGKNLAKIFENGIKEIKDV